ncbi:hypothetical protein HaLaN_17052 [Haematococcus lacustris]|uniref:Uncharacterized protein n=1 Tax=Haematococcus lacustris TaxID=44745 RepID=A0A699ZM50_HAELA|nr:hypothetical protein HaLaN_17052 [Haematococcus lacustris]
MRPAAETSAEPCCGDSLQCRSAGVRREATPNFTSRHQPTPNDYSAHDSKHIATHEIERLNNGTRRVPRRPSGNGHQLQQSWQLHVPATTMLQQLQQGLHWGIGDGAGKLGLSCRGQRRGGARPFEPAHDAGNKSTDAEVLEQLAKGDSPWWRPTLLPLKQL